MTVAISLLVHGEAVRFNRGQSRGDDYDFKYMRGRDGQIYPYVSGQCYKRYWRESLPGPPSPITRAKGAAGREENQAYTNGDPIKYVDDDLFGYMIAGAAETEEERVDVESIETEPPSDDVFGAGNLKNREALRRRLLEADNAVSAFILQSSPGAREKLQPENSSPEVVQDLIIKALNDAVNSPRVPESVLNENWFTKKKRMKFQEATPEKRREMLKDFIIGGAFRRELQDKPKRPTTRRTAPVRMHALVAFSGIKTAKDFQTFSRDVVYTGKNSVVNPNPQGIYSGWLKTRVLIESHRIGKFYIGENMELLGEQVSGQTIKSEKNPYSHDSDVLRFVELDEKERLDRLRAVLTALADIGNNKGPASGALHDGSLRPKAFVAGMMKCADSPFDDVWKGRNDEGAPFLDIAALTDVVKDWDDLFATRKLYFGLPHDLRTQIEDTIKMELSKLGFEFLIDSPRKALLTLAEEATL
jgi:hypothetical protein